MQADHEIEAENCEGRYFVSSDGLTLFYRDYSTEFRGTPVICIPGLTRNSRDFEDLAICISADRRVLSLDLRGRGYSENDLNWRNYRVKTYVQDVLLLLETLSISSAFVIGTSLGGLIAMGIANAEKTLLRGVIINDIGPEVPAGGLKRVLKYTGQLAQVDSWDAAIAQTREVYEACWPGLSDTDWRRAAKRAYREDEDGVPRPDMDPKIGDAIRDQSTQAGDYWELFHSLSKIPTMVIRGSRSDILTPNIISKMLTAKPDLQVVEIPKRGHVPLLNEPESMSAISDFLSKNDLR